jgi:nucleolar GTP-binding protein
MFNKIPTVLRPQEIIDKAFSRASKIEVPYESTLERRVRNEVISRVSTIESLTCNYLDKLVKRFPSSEKLHPFFYAILDLLFDIDRYKISLSRLNTSSNKIRELSTVYIRRVKGIDGKRINQTMREFYGRFSSIINDLSGDLSYLSECRDRMKKVPDINPEIQTFIIAGMPNTGKSSLISALTTSKPRIASYPFTTQDIHVGYRQIGYQSVQMIDTPGILDRPSSERNEMEVKALLALQKIDGVILFLFDHSPEAAYEMEHQENLYHEIKQMMSKPIVRVQSKLDISPGRVEEIAVSVSTGEGISELLKYMESILAKTYAR